MLLPKVGVPRGSDSCFCQQHTPAWEDGPLTQSFRHTRTHTHTHLSPAQGSGSSAPPASHTLAMPARQVQRCSLGSVTELTECYHHLLIHAQVCLPPLTAPTPLPSTVNKTSTTCPKGVRLLCTTMVQATTATRPLTYRFPALLPRARPPGHACEYTESEGYVEVPRFCRA